MHGHEADAHADLVEAILTGALLLYVAFVIFLLWLKHKRDQEKPGSQSGTTGGLGGNKHISKSTRRRRKKR